MQLLSHVILFACGRRAAKPGPAIEGARQAPKGELRIYPGIGHFDIYDGPSHEAVVADEVKFLHRHLLGRSLSGTTKAASDMTRVYLPALTSGENPVGEGIAKAPK